MYNWDEFQLSLPEDFTLIFVLWKIIHPMSFKRIAFLVSLALCGFHSFSQQNAQKLIDQYKDSLNNLAHVMQRGANDSSRFASAAVYSSIKIGRAHV